MRSRSNGGVIGAYALPTQNYANGVFFIHDAAIYNTGNNPIWPLGTGFIYSATGGTITNAVDNSNYKLHTFTANGTFSVVTGSAYIDILLVGGGGSSAYDYLNSSYTIYAAQGGGGGGAVALVQNLFVDGGTTFTVEVGAGGAIASYSTTSLSGVNGGPSKITSNRGHSIIARGGGAGNRILTISATSGGSGGGGGCQIINNGGINTYTGASAGATDAYTIGTATINFYQNAGGTTGSLVANNSSTVCAGGGGGAASAGYDGNYTFNASLRGYGGDGFLWAPTGLYYGAGGAGGSWPTTTQSGLYGSGQRITEAGSTVGGYGIGANGNTLNVGGGINNPAPKNGGSGTVIFRYRYQ